MYSQTLLSYIYSKVSTRKYALIRYGKYEQESFRIKVLSHGSKNYRLSWKISTNECLSRHLIECRYPRNDTMGVARKTIHLKFGVPGYEQQIMLSCLVKRLFKDNYITVVGS